MCLYLSWHYYSYPTNNYFKKHPTLKDTFIVYKKLYVNKYDKTLVSPVFNCRMKNNQNKFKNTWVIGKTCKSNRLNKRLSKTERNRGVVTKGIHVYSDINWLVASPPDYGSRYVYVKCLAKKSDLVAVGINDEAVFMKVKPIKKLSLRDMNKLVYK